MGDKMNVVGKINSKMPSQEQTTVEKVAAQRTVCDILVQAHLAGLANFELYELEAINKMKSHSKVWPEYLKGVLSKMINRIEQEGTEHEVR